MSVARDHLLARGCYRRLLVVIRHHAWPTIAIQYAVAWAARDAVVHVAIVPEADEEAGVARCMDYACGRDISRADAVRCALAARGVDATQSLVPPAHADANIRDSIARLARRWGADIVLTDDMAPAHLAQAAGCGVLHLPADGSRRFHVPPRRLFVASDDSASALCGVKEAERVAGAGELRRVFVSCEPEMATSPESSGSGTVVLTAAHPGDNLAHAILQAAHAWCADLLVLGTHGAGPQARWRYGSVAAAVALFTDMPLLVVPEKS
jgi:nucleotide-binding universal stress UspA family protein